MMEQEEGRRVVISIHALLAESDDIVPMQVTYATKFQSTLSLRRATAGGHGSGRDQGISIHALLAESD